MAKFVPAAVRSYGGYDADAVSEETGLQCNDISKTRQADAKDADINNIVRSFGVTGTLPAGGVRIPSYQDFEDVFDFRSALEAVKAAEASFMALPAQVRSRFQNDPQEFVEFCSDPKNIEELRELGLAPKAPAADPAPSPESGS